MREQPNERSGAWMKTASETREGLFPHTVDFEKTDKQKN